VEILTQQKTKKPEGRNTVKKPFRKLAAAAVLAGSLAACTTDVNVNLIPYIPAGDGGAGACLTASDTSVDMVGECQESKDNEMRTGEMVIVGNAGFQLSDVVDSGATKAARFTPIDGADECASGSSEDILAGETRVLTVNGEQYRVAVSSIEYDTVGPKVMVSVTPDCYQEPDGGAGGSD
jgi:hypothetical protein